MENSILIIDTDNNFVAQANPLLQNMGIEVLIAQDGIDGLNQARERAPGSILMDVALPYLSGLHVCKLLKNDERFNSIPIVFLSSKDDPDTVLNTQRVGGDAFLRKPITDDQLVRELIQILS